jgi:Domain of unknown function (DUF4862)
MTYLVGAYAALPAHMRWTAAERAFLDELAADRSAAGFETPVYADWTPDSMRDVLRHTRRGNDIILTTLPGTMPSVAKRAAFGLASTDPDGRAAALADIGVIRDHVLRLHDRAERRVVRSIAIAFAPRTTDAGLASACFAESLAEVGSWDWDGAQLVVEHCDAKAGWHPPAKGFLPLRDEIDAVTSANQQADRPIGMCVNWGRSTLETRQAATPRVHLAVVSDAGLLAGLMFSGCSAQASVYGDAWSDVHLPPSSVAGLDCGDAQSLLTCHHMTECLDQIEDRQRVYVGLKISTPRELSAFARLSIVRNSVESLRRADKRSKHAASLARSCHD